MKNENKPTPQVLFFRPPTEEEQIAGMAMNAYINWVLLARKDIFFPNYSCDLKETFDMMAMLSKINPMLHKATTKKLDENGGMKAILSSGHLVASTTICNSLITAAKEIANLREKKAE